MFPNDVNNMAIFLAIVASMGGCCIRYANVYKHEVSRTKFSFFFIDLFISIFLGYFVFWFSLEELKIHMSKAMLINCYVGYIGSKVFDLGSYFLYKKCGFNIKFEKREDKIHDSKRYPK